MPRRRSTYFHSSSSSSSSSSASSSSSSSSRSSSSSKSSSSSSFSGDSSRGETPVTFRLAPHSSQVNGSPSSRSSSSTSIAASHFGQLIICFASSPLRQPAAPSVGRGFAVPSVTSVYIYHDGSGRKVTPSAKFRRSAPSRRAGG